VTDLGRARVGVQCTEDATLDWGCFHFGGISQGQDKSGQDREKVSRCKRPEKKKDQKGRKMVGLECSVEEHLLAGPSPIIKQPATALRSKETRLSAASRLTCGGTRNAMAKSAREMGSKPGPNPQSGNL
jgi:hypothetical protein